jgi:hypothetical protein
MAMARKMPVSRSRMLLRPLLDRAAHACYGLRTWEAAAVVWGVVLGTIDRIGCFFTRWSRTQQQASDPRGLLIF